MGGKVLMISRDPFGKNIRLRNEAFALVRKGFAINVICFGDEGLEYMENGVRVQQFVEPKLYRKFSALTAEVPVYTLWATQKLRKLPELHDYRIIHVYNIFLFKAVHHLVNREKVRLVLDIAENLPEIMKSYDHTRRGMGRWLVSFKRWHRLQRKCIQMADKVIVVTREAGEWYTHNYKTPAEKFITLPNVIDPELIGNSAREKILDRFSSGFNLFYFGDTSVRRGTLFAIDAMLELQKHIPNVRLIIVGQNRREDILLKRRVKNLNLENCVFLEGYQGMDKLGSYLEVSHIGLSPLQRNVHHDTTLANKIFQYMYGSLAQVVSDCPAQANIVITHKCGEVYPAGNTDVYIEKILNLFKQSAKRIWQGKNGRDAVIEKYLWDDVIRAYSKYLLSFQISND